MKITKQMKEDLIFLRKAQMILRKYWGNEGVDKFAKIKTDIDGEVESMLGKSLHEVKAYILKSFTAWGWDTDKINTWFDGQKSPFRNNIQLGEQDLADVHIAEFGLVKLAQTLLNSGMAFRDANHLVTATLMGSRPSYRQIVDLIEGKS